MPINDGTNKNETTTHEIPYKINPKPPDDCIHPFMHTSNSMYPVQCPGTEQGTYC